MSSEDPIGTNQGSRIREVMGARFRTSKLDDPRLPRKAAHRASLVSVLQTDSGGRGENPKARERTQVKELGKMTP